ncbi:MAG: thioredoxin domain-containing protein, partial [Desulfotomaculaceae bacterium]|nr:thioredoxin domain-containing protein [Desulfotomaculaceae bacterium]
HMRRADGRLLARFRDGEAEFPAYLDDYAFLTWELIELYEATFEAAYLEKAVGLIKQTLDLFWDQENGGFYLYGIDAEQLIARPKETYDGALPSGNSVALANLLRLARLTGDEALTQTAEKLVSAFAGEVQQAPHGYPHFLIGVDFLLGPAREIVIAGETDDPWVNKMLQTVRKKYLPEAVVIFHPSGTDGRDIEKIAPFLTEQLPIEGKATAYICQNYACQAPVTEYSELVDML